MNIMGTGDGGKERRSRPPLDYDRLTKQIIVGAVVFGWLMSISVDCWNSLVNGELSQTLSDVIKQGLAALVGFLAQTGINKPATGTASNPVSVTAEQPLPVTETPKPTPEPTPEPSTPQSTPQSTPEPPPPTGHFLTGLTTDTPMPPAAAPTYYPSLPTVPMQEAPLGMENVLSEDGKDGDEGEPLTL